MFVNALQQGAGTAATGASAVLFGLSVPAFSGGFADERASSSFAYSAATFPGTTARNSAAGLSRFGEAWQLRGPVAPPPGGGARKPDAPGSPSGGNGGGGPKRKATLSDVIGVMRQLKLKRERVSLLPHELEFLENEGLIERMGVDEYKRHEKSLLRVEFLENDLSAARDERLRITKDRNNLLKVHHSRWHMFFTSGKKLAEEAAELKRSLRRIEEISGDIKRIDEELKRLDITKDYIETFVRTPYGYMRLSRKGEQLLEEIKERNGE